MRNFFSYSSTRKLILKLLFTYWFYQFRYQRLLVFYQWILYLLYFKTLQRNKSKTTQLHELSGQFISPLLAVNELGNLYSFMLSKITIISAYYINQNKIFNHLFIWNLLTVEAIQRAPYIITVSSMLWNLYGVIYHISSLNWPVENWTPNRIYLKSSVQVNEVAQLNSTIELLTKLN